jgi:hypothetical protein
MAIAPLDNISHAAPLERRQTHRIAVLIEIMVDVGGQSIRGRITEMSRAGARIEMVGRRAVGELLKK